MTVMLESVADMDYVPDWFGQLLLSNDIIKHERVSMVPFLAATTPVVELIFLKCSLFEQPDEVRYLSVELFDRFIRLHFKTLLEKVWSQEKELASKQWQQVERKLFSQTPLRMLSCIQLASKFVLHSKILRPKEIQTHLRAEGKMYTLQMILSSEMRVWRTLNFQINVPTVLTYVDLILAKIRLSTNKAYVLPKDIANKAVLFTDVVYLHHQEIYRKLFYFVTGRWEGTLNEKNEFLPTECDALYTAAAVVALSITFTQCVSEVDIFKSLSIITHLSPNDIQVLVTVINQIVLS